MIRRTFDWFGGLIVGILAVATLFATANTEIMTEISAALGNNAAVKQILHISNDDGIASTRTAVYDADGTGSYLYLGTTSLSVNDGTDNLLLFSGLTTTMAVGQAAGDDFIVEDTTGTDMVVFEGDDKDYTFTGDGTANSDLTFTDGTDNLLKITGGTTKSITMAIGSESADDYVLEDTAGTDIITIQGDVKDVLFTFDGTAASDFLINDGGGVILTVASDENAVTWLLDASADADYSIGKSGTEQFLLESDIGLFSLTSDGGFDLVIGTDAGDDFLVNDGTDNLIHAQGNGGSVTINLAAGAGNDFAIHDGTQNVMLVETDDQTVEFIGDVMIVNGAYDFDVASHDGTNGLMLEGVLVTSSAAEINKLDGLGATMAELNIAADVLTEVVTGTNVIGAEESGTRFVLNTATAFVTTLPTEAAGLHFWFYVGATEPTTSHTIITTSSTNTIQGQVATSEDAAGSVATTADSDTITFVQNLAIHGDWVYVWCDGTSWFVTGMCKVQDAITTTQVS